MKMSSRSEKRLPIRTAEFSFSRDAQPASSSSPGPRKATRRTSHGRPLVEAQSEDEGYVRASYYDSGSSNSAKRSRSNLATEEAPSEDGAYVRTKCRDRGHYDSGTRQNDEGVSIQDCSEESGDGKPGNRGRRGHNYRYIVNQGSARAHLGDLYIERQINYTGVGSEATTYDNDQQINLLQALAFPHMNTRLANVSPPHGQTCQWLFDSEEYIGWRTALHSQSLRRFLWIKGKPGAGKSTMIKLAWKQASQDFPNSIVASFFFNARGHGTAKSTEGMYRSLLHQICSSLARLPSEIASHVSINIKRDGWPVPTLQNYLREILIALPKEKSLVCYIDALDESEEDDIRFVLNHMEELRALSVSQHINFLICFASRHYPNFTIPHHRPVNLDEQTRHRDDISQYMASTLRVEESLGKDILQSTNARSDGVFLWAVLTVQILNKMSDTGATRSQLLSRLREVPDSLQALFGEILQKGDKYLLPMLQWVLFARYSMSAKELYFAVMVSMGELKTGIWSQGEISVHGMHNFIITSSRGLVECSAEGTHLIHESLREYLLQTGLIKMDQSLMGDFASISHERLARWCLSYFELNSIHDLDAEFPLVSYVVTSTIHHLEMALVGGNLSQASLRRFADLWLTSDLYWVSLQSLFDCATLLCYSIARQCMSFASGTSNGMPVGLFDSPMDLTDFLKLAMRKTFGATAEVIGATTKNSDVVDLLARPSPIIQAAANVESVDVVQLFHVRTTDLAFQIVVVQALFLSAGLGMGDVLELLLDRTVCKRDQLRQRALSIAAVNLRYDTVMLLLDRGVQFDQAFRRNKILRELAGADNPPGFDGDADQVRFEIAKALLDAGASVRHALAPACARGRVRLVKLFLGAGAKVYHSAIHIARTRNRMECLRILLEARANNATGDNEDSEDDADASDASTKAVSRKGYF